MSPGGPNSGLLSTQSTFEQQPRLVVPTNVGSTVKIELPQKARSFIEQQEKSNSSSDSGAETQQQSRTRRDGGWLSKVFNRRERRGENEKESC